MKLDPKQFKGKIIHNLASSVGAKVGRLYLDLVVDGPNVSYRVKHNDRIKVKSLKIETAVEKFNKIHEKAEANG